MGVKKINDVFLDSELDFLNSIIKDTHSYYKDNGNSLNVNISKDLGRIEITKVFIPLPNAMYNKLIKLSSDFFDVPHQLANVVYVEYSKEYGNPNLSPHFDGDTNDLIINYQLSSNTSWDIGIDLKLYSLEDNSALLFNPNKKIHWRPHKNFNDGESVKMVFFRFCKIGKQSDYSYLSYSQDHEIFKEVSRIRDGSPTGT